MTKNKQLEAIEKRFDEKWKTFWTKEGDLKIHPHKIKQFIKAEFNDYFTARLEEVLPKKRELNYGDNDWQDGHKTGFNQAIKQTKRNKTMKN